jgi:streptogramin lyase
LAPSRAGFAAVCDSGDAKITDTAMKIGKIDLKKFEFIQRKVAIREATMMMKTKCADFVSKFWPTYRKSSQ